MNNLGSKIALALCMGLHPRLGAESPIQRLTSDLVERFFSAIPICIPEDYPYLLDAIEKHPKRRSLHILFRGKTNNHSGEHPVGARAGGEQTPTPGFVIPTTHEQTNTALLVFRRFCRRG